MSLSFTTEQSLLTENIAPSSVQCCENSMALTVSYLIRKLLRAPCNCVTSLEIPCTETHLTRGRVVSGHWAPCGHTLVLVTSLTVVCCDLNAEMVTTPLQLSSHWASQDWLPDGAYFVHFLHCTLCVRLDWQGYLLVIKINQLIH